MTGGLAPSPSRDSGRQAPSILVVGGTGVAGGAAITAVRKTFGAAAGVTALWYARKEEEISIEGADHTIFGDVTEEETCRRDRKSVV